MSVECIDAPLELADSVDPLHAYIWEDLELSPRRILVLIHGLMMHGRSFESLARELASEANIVVAPDLRGFGRWYYARQDDKAKIDFQQSLEDLRHVLTYMQGKYPGLPVFCAGESLGAHLARQLVSMQAELISGVILSSPCVRPKMFSLPLIPHTCSELLLSGIDSRREINLSPFAQRLLRQEDENLQYYLEDPMTRKSLEILELIDSLKISSAFEFRTIPEDIPILVLRGKNDCVCKFSSTKEFLASLSSKSMTVHNCSSSGHLILQASKIKKEIITAIRNWLYLSENQAPARQ